MHLIVAFAAPSRSDAGRRALTTVQAPTLQALLGPWRETQRDVSGDETRLSMPHERALARAFDWALNDGLLPWAARLAQHDGIAVGNQAWGLVSPTHWRLGSDRIDLVDPEALALDAPVSRQLFDSAAPVFEAAGFRLAWGAPQRWYAAHESLRSLATASLDRVAGRNIEPWLPDRIASRALRRLQSEVQMLWHTHPVNSAREAAGALPINSFWLSACGVFQSVPADAQALLEQDLRSAALAEDWPAWTEAWRALDAGPIAQLATAFAHGQAVQLTLCGERGSLTLAPQPRAWWQRLRDLWSPPPSLAQLLEAL